MKRVYIWLDDQGKINQVFGTLKRAHKHLLDNRICVHRSYINFERFFKQYGDNYEINDGKGTIEKFDIL